MGHSMEIEKETPRPGGLGSVVLWTRNRRHPLGLRCYAERNTHGRFKWKEDADSSPVDRPT